MHPHGDGDETQERVHDEGEQVAQRRADMPGTEHNRVIQEHRMQDPREQAVEGLEKNRGKPEQVRAGACRELAAGGDHPLRTKVHPGGLEP